MGRMTWIYSAALVVLLVLLAISYGWYQHLAYLTGHVAVVAAQAGKQNHHVAANYASSLAGQADAARDWMLAFFVASGTLIIGGFIEYVVLPLLSLSRVGAMTRVTYHEALWQPFTLIALGLCVAAIGITAFVPFNTFGDDTKMYRDVALSFILMFVLVIMVFATGKVIDEEIENRTMLTLMSKPIARWQVIVGKYLGIICLIFVSTAALTLLAGTCAWLRYFSDHKIDIQAASFQGRQLLFWYNDQYMLALIPAFVLQFMEVATLAAVSTAIATRFGLALNMTVIVLLYIAANLTRFVPLLNWPSPWQSLANAVSYLLPYLSNFDLNQCLVYRHLTVGDHYIKGAPTYGQVWRYTGLACTYGVFYIGAALAVAVALFRNRELT